MKIENYVEELKNCITREDVKKFWVNFTLCASKNPLKLSTAQAHISVICELQTEQLFLDKINLFFPSQDGDIIFISF